MAIVLSSRLRENQPEAGEGQNLQVTIRDNGRGFDPDQNPASHYGLLDIRERLRQHTGQLVIKSAPQQGTILTIKLPLPDAALERPARS